MSFVPDDDHFNLETIHSDVVHHSHAMANMATVNSHSGVLLFPEDVNDSTALDGTDDNNDVKEEMDDFLEERFSLVQRALTAFATRKWFDAHCASQFGAGAKKLLL